MVTAEELAPYLEPLALADPDPESTYKDEGYVLPALIKFGGEPLVDEQGHLLYRFPALQKSGRVSSRRGIGHAWAGGSEFVTSGGEGRAGRFASMCPGGLLRPSAMLEVERVCGAGAVPNPQVKVWSPTLK